MGNCQAIDNASLVIQHPNGKVERLYSTVTASEVMKLNPGHHIALLLTTVLYSSRQPSTTTTTTTQPLRVTKIKLLRHNDNLTVGHNYRLITTQEVMKGIMAKKNGKTINNNIVKHKPSEEATGKHETTNVRSNQPERKHHLNKSENNRRRVTSIKGRGWHPSLNSISEASN